MRREEPGDELLAYVTELYGDLPELLVRSLALYRKNVFDLLVGQGSHAAQELADPLDRSVTATHTIIIAQVRLRGKASGRSSVGLRAVGPSHCRTTSRSDRRAGLAILKCLC